jgi:hypothetical protein
MFTPGAIPRNAKMPRYLSEERHETLFTGESMRSKEVQIGIRVHEGYGKAHLRGLIGTIKKRYGGER